MQEIVAARGGRLVTFDDETTLNLARADPIGFLQHDEPLLAIDEIQLAPEMVSALKYVVDRDQRPGRFLVTGSADLLRLPAAKDSLAGRVESIELHGSARVSSQDIARRSLIGYSRANDSPVTQAL